MRKIGIVASKTEQIKKHPWWKFWKREDDYEEFVFDELDYSVVIVYVPNSNFEQYDEQIAAFFRSCGVQHYCNSAEESADELQRALLVKKLQYIARKFGRDTRSSSVIFQSETLDFFLLMELAKICKSILIVTTKTIEAARISDKIFSELGLLLDVKSELPLHTGEYDYLLNISGEILSVEDDKLHKLRILSEKIPLLPVKVNALRLLETLWKSGIIDLDDISLK